MLARWLAEECRLLLLTRPISGVDIRAAVISPQDPRNGEDTSDLR